MARTPATERVVAAQSNLAAVAYAFLFAALLVMSLLAWAVHARAEVPAVVFAVEATTVCCTHAFSSQTGSQSIIATRQSHGQPSPPCHSGSCCCDALCHAPAELATAAELPAAAGVRHLLSLAGAAARESLSPDRFRPADRPRLASPAPAGCVVGHFPNDHRRK